MSFTIEQKEALAEKYLDLILEANKVTNLTRIVDREQAMILHLEDSLVGLDEINESPDGLYGDLGTGGGFPGVPVAIYTGRDTVLVDSVKKKMAILDNAVNELELPNNVITYAGRIEDLAKEKPGQFSVLSARALSQLPSLLELASPLLKKNGRLVCYKANISDEERNHALSIAEIVGMRIVSSRQVYLSDNETFREIFVFEKFKKPQIKLPRRIGLAQHDPIKPKK